MLEEYLNNLDRGEYKIRIKSYIIIYHLSQQELEKSLRDNGIDNFIVLNRQSAVIYLPENYDTEKLKNIDVIDWLEESVPMSSLINITNNLNDGINVLKFFSKIGRAHV